MVIARGPGRWLWLVASGLMALAVLFAACGDDDGDGEASAEEIATVENLIRQMFETGPEEVDFAMAHVTDNFLETVFFTTREECVANAEDCLGDPSPAQSVTGTTIDGDTATTRATADFGTFDIGLVRVDGEWLVDSFRAVSDEVPAGAATVDLGLTEFAFTYDEANIPADGNFVFHASNDGQQVHEVAIGPVPEGMDLEQALDALDEESVVGLKLYIQPGQDVDVAFAEPLAPGRYVMVCFFPDTDDPEGTPHAEKGMISEFTIE